MREVTDHKVLESHSGDVTKPANLNEALVIYVLDEPGHGGACHKYQIAIAGPDEVLGEINFQNGPIKEHGVNGVSNEALLAIVIDRLRSFQAGQFACEDNEQALTNAKYALKALQKRTYDRIARGVEGTHQQ